MANQLGIAGLFVAFYSRSSGIFDRPLSSRTEPMRLPLALLVGAASSVMRGSGVVLNSLTMSAARSESHIYVAIRSLWHILLYARGCDGHTPRHNEVRLVVFFRIGDWIVRIEDGKPKLLV